MVYSLFPITPPQSLPHAGQGGEADTANPLTWGRYRVKSLPPARGKVSSRRVCGWTDEVRFDCVASHVRRQLFPPLQLLLQKAFDLRVPCSPLGVLVGRGLRGAAAQKLTQFGFLAFQ